MQKVFAVIGGGGFLGRWVVEELIERRQETKSSDLIKILDVRQTWQTDQAEFVQCDITKPDMLQKALHGVTCVIHTASPPHGRGAEVYFAVNVVGTRNVIDACVLCGVKQLIFTSSASVVFSGADLRDVDESTPYCTTFLDPYTETKQKAEIEVLRANGRGGLLTVALRPSGIFGPRDQQAWPGFIEAARAGKSKYQVGSGENLMDWTYVQNVAQAHVLAADALQPGAACAGKPYFITNGEPIKFWSMARYIFKELEYPEPTVTVPTVIAVYLSLAIDLFVRVLSPVVTLHPTFTYFRIINATATRYFSINAARRDLGYNPKVKLEEGMRRTLEAFKDMRNPDAPPKADKTKSE